MRLALLASLLLLAGPAVADSPLCDGCPPVGKVFREPFRCKPGLQKVVCKGQKRCLPPKEAVCPIPVPPEAPVAAPAAPPAARPAQEAPPRAPAPPQDEPSRWHVGPYAQLGSGLSEPRSVFTRQYSTYGNGGMIEWDIGYHAHYLPWRLGARAYFAGPLYGPGMQLQLYLWQGEGLEVHLDGGLLYSGIGTTYASTVDVQRDWDFQYGLGLELPVTPELVLMLDGRVSHPLGHQATDLWSHEVGNVATNALHQFHLLVGVMYRTP